MYSIAVILLSSAIVMLIIIGCTIQRNMLEKLIILSQNDRNAASGAELYLAGEIYLETDDSITVDLFRDGASFVDIALSKWGALDILLSKARATGMGCNSLFLTGFEPQEGDSTALYLADKGRYLSISGKTRLSGACFLPAGTAIISSIEGQPYLYKQIVTGGKYASKKNLPSLDEEIYRFAQMYLEGGLHPDDSVINLLSGDKHLLLRSFTLAAIVGKSESELVISDSRIYGKVILISNRKITITADSKIEDAILIAPELEIQPGFKGSFQAFASKKIEVGDNCILEMPTVLSVLHGEQRYNPGDSLQILIRDNCVVSGNVILNTYGLTCYMKLGVGSSI